MKTSNSQPNSQSLPILMNKKQQSSSSKQQKQQAFFTENGKKEERFSSYFMQKYQHLDTMTDYYRQQQMNTTSSGFRNSRHKQMFEQNKDSKAFTYVDESLVKQNASRCNTSYSNNRSSVMKKSFQTSSNWGLLSSYNSLHISSQMQDLNIFINKSNKNPVVLFEQYWELIVQLKLEKVLVLTKNQQQIQEYYNALKYEILSMALINFFIQFESTYGVQLFDEFTMYNAIRTNHQNFMLIGEFMISRIKNQNNSKILKLKQIFFQKSQSSLTQQKKTNMKSNNTLLLDLIHEIYEFSKYIDVKNRQFVLQKPLFKSIKEFIHDVAEIQIEEIREKVANTLAISVLNLQKISQINPQLFAEDDYTKKLYENENDNDEQYENEINSDINNQEVPQAPFLNYEPTKQYTLVLDLDETLIHYNDQFIDKLKEYKLKKRPNLQNFLKEMSKHYELIIFTAGLDIYAEKVLSILDPNSNLISKLLCRQYTMQDGSTYVKDISQLGRDLSKTIIIDNVMDNFKLQKENGIFIKSWFDDKEDKELYNILPILKYIVNEKVDDVRVALKVYRDNMIRMQSNINIQDPHFKLKTKV